LNRFFRSAFFPLLVIVALAWLASETLRGDDSKEREATYSSVRGNILNNPTSIEKVTFDPKKHGISVDYKDGTVAKVNYPTDQSQLEFETLLKEKNVAYDSKGTGSSAIWVLLSTMLPFIILIGFWIFLMNQVQGGGSKVMSFGKSRAKRMTPDSPKIGFKDVAGADEAVEELHEIKEFLENPKKFQALGARIPKGVLLYGPPGTGKTLLARAVAGEAGGP
jgi:cell division protease FtsH